MIAARAQFGMVFGDRSLRLIVAFLTVAFAVAGASAQDHPRIDFPTAFEPGSPATLTGKAEINSGPPVHLFLCRLPASYLSLNEACKGIGKGVPPGSPSDTKADGHFAIPLAGLPSGRYVVVQRLEIIGAPITSYSDPFVLSTEGNGKVTVGGAVPPPEPLCRIDAPLRAVLHTKAPQGDYVVITYDAGNGRMYWTDGKTPFRRGQDPLADGNDTTEIWHNSPFTPFILTREKIYVLFCNMHFGDAYSVTSNGRSIVEASVDIRNGSAANIAGASPITSGGAGDVTVPLNASLPDLTMTISSIDASKPAAVAAPDPSKSASASNPIDSNVYQAASSEYLNQRSLLISDLTAAAQRARDLVTSLRTAKDQVSNERTRLGEEFFTNPTSYLGLLAQANSLTLNVNAFSTDISSSKFPDRVQALMANLQALSVPASGSNRPIDASTVFDSFNDLRTQVSLLRTATNSLFNDLNTAWQQSRVQNTISLDTQSTVTLLDLSISVKSMHTPFVVSTTASPAVAAPTVLPPSHASLMVEVHRKVYFNAIAGGLVIKMSNPTYGAVTCSAGTCVGLTSTSNYQVEGMFGIVWHPEGRDYFPFGSRGSVGVYRGRGWIPGVLVGTSVTSLGNGFIGLDEEPVNGFNFFAGIANATRTDIARGSGLAVGSVLTSGSSGTVPTTQHQHGAFSFGVGFDLKVFCGIFLKSCGS